MDEYSSLDAAHAAIHKENIMEHGVTDKIENIFKPHMGGHDGMGLGGGGFGAGLVGGLLGGALLGNRRGGLFGGDGCGDGVSPAQAAFDQSIMNGVNGLTAAVPSNALQTQNAILESQNAIQNAIASFALGTSQGFSNVKDSVTNTGTVLLQSGNQNTQSILNAICGLSSKIDAGTIANLQAELAEVRTARATDGVRVDVTQTVSQNQAQLQAQNQQQQQFQILANLSATVANLANDIQVVRQGQTIFNSGTMAGSGTQAAANTRVS